MWYKWINVWIAMITIPLNLYYYFAYGSVVNLVTAIVCFVIAASAFLACVAIENSFRR